jgi:P27 family predicted phage terminase small subunit
MTTIIPIQGGDETPEEPSWAQYSEEYQEIAHAEWGRVTRHMKTAGTLAVANGHAISRLCHFRVLYEKAMLEVAKNGAILEAKKSNAAHGVYSPFWIIANRADASISRLEGELGISPTGRKRAGKVASKPHKTQASDAYLKRKGQD